MKKFLPLLLSALLLLSGCTGENPATLIEMELTNNYDTSDTVVHEKLFYVDKNIEALELNISFQMEGESGVLEILENETKQSVWSDRWDGDIDKITFTALLNDIETEKEYVIKFTGTKTKYAKIVITSEENLIKEREKPLKPNRG